MARWPSTARAEKHYAAIGGPVVNSPGYTRQHGRPRLDALREHVLLGDDDSVAGTPEKQWLEELGQGARFALRSNSRDAQLAAALAGAGVALLPCYLADSEPGLLICRGARQTSAFPHGTD